MISREVYEAVDRTFRDILKAETPIFADIPFGGCLFVFGGGFRQIMLVIPKGSRADIVSSCLNMSFLWQYITVLKLRVNMRVKQALNRDNPNLALQLQAFADYLLDIGDDKVETLSINIYQRPTKTDLIKLPKAMVVPGNNLINLLRGVYPGLYSNPQTIDHSSMMSSAILTTKNKDVASINELLLRVFPGESRTYYSADKPKNMDNQQLAPTELLNSIETGSLPPHALTLKIGVPVMCLRNLNPKQGLCNGTRLIVKCLLANVIEACIATGSHAGTVVYIPRVKIHTDNDPSVLMPFERCQFPVRLAFGMTINKAQGQTLDSLGLYLPNHVFGHGQLYVALSRVKTPESIKIMVDSNCNTKLPHSIQSSNETYTRNVVYTEVVKNYSPDINMES